MPHQVFYVRPYNPLHEFATLAIICTAFTCINGYTTCHPVSSISFTLNLVNGFLGGGAVGLCLCNISFEPTMTWTTEKRVGGSCVDIEAVGDGDSAGAGAGGGSLSGGNSGSGRIVKVKRPIFGFKRFERTFETEDEVWRDGFRYEKAFVRI
ncbi:uncharacterized protein ACHE_31099A [Aspergillus chevalieri]|uniref:Uncharacterized protein n=1 Tax=Aspergillus chevalieri TaxID=182096 RepID=A0A7R7VMB7_ASPCH|nr:uncharacterized protein ACHE_31099A [Aspergillus chevalieri]BCR87112.1 hypothetical protein ACHE_31099A [Aspergillus chevalieri]